MRVFSLGELSRRLQRSPIAIEQALTEVAPDLEIDGRKYWGIEAEAKLDADFRRLDIEAIQRRPRPE
jgi:hypothetical protein